MDRIARRTLASAVGLLPTLLLPGLAQATLMRGLSLRDLAAQSRHVLILTALDSQCTEASIGGRRMIVTETLARVEDVLLKAAPARGEVVVCTLGGVLGGMGQLVHGQADFVRDTPCVAFLTDTSAGSSWVTGMAQGHYPIANGTRSEQYLTASPHLPTLVDFEHSAARALRGRALFEARRLLLEASAP